MKVFKSEKGRAAVCASYDRLLRLWGVETKESDIDGKYGTTHIVQAGNRNNPPLLLFHGVGDNSAMMWLYNAAALAEEYFITAVDSIGGAGKSIPSSGYGKGFSQSDWISGIMDNLNIRTAAAAGVSYGCYLVQLLKMELPDRIGRIVGMSGTIAAEETKSGNLRMMKVFLPEALFPNDKNVMKLIEKLTGPENINVTGNAELMEHWKLLLRNFSNVSMAYHNIKRRFSEDEFRSIKDESLFIIGNRDPLSYFPGSCDYMDKYGMNYEIILNAGHAVNHEKPSAINDKIIKFLNKI